MPGRKRGSLESSELRALDKTREEVDNARRLLRTRIAQRNRAVDAAKKAGHPAGSVYRRAGITPSTYSRRPRNGG